MIFSNKKNKLNYKIILKYIFFVCKGLKKYKVQYYVIIILQYYVIIIHFILIIMPFNSLFDFLVE